MTKDRILTFEETLAIIKQELPHLRVEVTHSTSESVGGGYTFTPYRSTVIYAKGIQTHLGAEPWTAYFNGQFSHSHPGFTRKKLMMHIDTLRNYESEE